MLWVLSDQVLSGRLVFYSQTRASEFANVLEFTIWNVWCRQTNPCVQLQQLLSVVLVSLLDGLRKILLLHLVQTLNVQSLALLFLLFPHISFDLSQSNVWSEYVDIGHLFSAHVVSALWYKCFKRYLFVIIYTFNLDLAINIYSSLFKLSSFLKLGQPSSLFKFLFTCLSFRFFTASISKPCPAFLQHLLFVFIHIYWVWSRRLSFRIRIDLASS